MIKFKKIALGLIFITSLASCSISFGPTPTSSNFSTTLPTTTTPTTALPTTSVASSSSLKNEKVIQKIEWINKPVVNSYYGEPLSFSSYGKIRVIYQNQTTEEVTLQKENMKTNRIDINSFDLQYAYINYEDFSLRFEVQLEKRKASSSVEFVKKLGVGWNLGNAFSASLDGFDTTHNRGIVEELGFSMDELEMFCEVRDQPQAYRGKITKATIQAVYKKGFRSIRIPISWSNHMGTDGTIHEKWMARIQEVVNYIYQDYDDVYIILTLMDGLDGYDLSNAHQQKTMNLITNVWTQVSERFKDYDERLIFENLNEPMYDENLKWDMNPKQTKYQALYKEANQNLMKYNQKFVDIVRASSSEKNKNRYLTVNTYGNISEYAYDEAVKKVSQFNLPNDTANDKILYNGHAYYPHYFCYHNNDNGQYTDSWSANSVNDTKPITDMFQNLYNTYVKNGIGVIISEWGSVDRNVNGRDQARVNHAYYYMKTATDYDIACFVWDNGAVSGDNHEEAFGFLNKHKASGLYDDMVKKSYVNYENEILWYHENILSSIFKGYQAGTAIL